MEIHPEVVVEPERDNLIGYVFHTAEIVCVPERRIDDEHEWDLDFLQTTDEETGKKTDIFGFIAAPVISSDDTVQGVIMVFNKTQPKEIFSDYDLFSIEQISRFASNAFKAWESIHAAQNAKQRMEVRKRGGGGEEWRLLTSTFQKPNNKTPQFARRRLWSV